MEEGLEDEHLEDLTQRLAGLGFPSDQARAFLHLTRHGPMSAAALAKSLRTSRPRAYRILEALMAEGFALSQLGRPRLYTAVPGAILFKALEVRWTARLEALAEARRELLPLIEASQATAEPGTQASFTMLQARDLLEVHVLEAFGAARSSLDLAIAGQLGLDLLATPALLSALAARARHGVTVRILADGRSPELDAALARVPTAQARRSGPVALSTFLVVDRRDVVVVVRPGSAQGTDRFLGLQTNVAHFVATHSYFFDSVWRAAQPVPAPGPRRRA